MITLLLIMCLAFSGCAMYDTSNYETYRDAQRDSYRCSDIGAKIKCEETIR